MLLAQMNCGLQALKTLDYRKAGVQSPDKAKHCLPSKVIDRKIERKKVVTAVAR